MSPSPDPNAARRLLIWGGGGHGKVVADLARAAGFIVAGFVDRDASKVGAAIEPMGARVLLDEVAFLAGLARTPGEHGAVALAIGDNAARVAAYRRLQGRVECPRLVHPSAVISSTASVGCGSVVLPQVVVNTAATVGQAVILNSGSVVEHDCELDDGVHISPNATLAGGVRIGAESWIGAGATIIQGVRVGARCMVGAGAVVLRDVPDGTKVVGCPAKPI